MKDMKKKEVKFLFFSFHLTFTLSDAKMVVKVHIFVVSQKHLYLGAIFITDVCSVNAKLYFYKDIYLASMLCFGCRVNVCQQV